MAAHNRTLISGISRGPGFVFVLQDEIVLVFFPPFFIVLETSLVYLFLYVTEWIVATGSSVSVKPVQRVDISSPP